MKTYQTLPSGIKIVEYTPTLAQTLADMWNASTEDWGGGTSLKAASQVIAQHQTATHYNVFVALDGNVAVGYCSFGRYFYDSDTLYIPLLGVRPDYKNKKIGKALVLQCVQRTIELGYKRLDLFTWSGNTAAVPLYKKCGFLWEDRPDSVHLTNFIPQIVTTPLFSEFFAHADWYADSTRSLDIAPDGKETNKFELFTYSWEKEIRDEDNKPVETISLSVGFERSGKHLRMIETNDYKIEFMAQDHALAFGTEYDCEFALVNKSGKPLKIEITGRDDKNISFAEHRTIDCIGNTRISSRFRVGEVTDIQDPWKVHPCLLADVKINGHTVTFGLGIEPKFPLLVELVRECVVDQVGAEVQSHLAFTSALLEAAEIAIQMPDSSLVAINDCPATVHVPAKGRASVPINTTATSIGFENLQIACTATLENGATVKFDAPLAICTRDMTHAYYGEDLNKHYMYNGPWEISFDKKSNDQIRINHLTNNRAFYGAFETPKFGKPYDDEFNLIKPVIKMRREDTAMIAEVEYVSEKFSGMAVTQVYTIHASGQVSRHSIIENRTPACDKSAKPIHVQLRDSYWLGLATRSVFSYDGQIVQNHETKNADASAYAMGCINPELLDENWVFEACPFMPRGFVWPAEYKPIVQWSTDVYFEIDPGSLAPGEKFVTKPVFYCLGLFANYNDFRNYARQLHIKEPQIPAQIVDVKLNGTNPFVQQQVMLEILNNREQVLAGTITVTSNIFEAATQTNPTDKRVEKNTFDLTLLPGRGNIEVANIAISTVNFEKSYNRAMFVQSGEVVCIPPSGADSNLYTVTNGAITFKIDPAYSNGCHSLIDAAGQEWLLSKYPNHEPHAWWNPFLGGIRLGTNINPITMLKENITAELTEVEDCFGNNWKGICTTLAINEYEELKGAIYKTYFVTLPGVPVLCVFYRLFNATGFYMENAASIMAYITASDDSKNILVEMRDIMQREYCLRMGTDDFPDVPYEDTAAITSDRKNVMHLFHANKNNDKNNTIWGNNKIPLEALFETTAATPHGKSFTSSPVFFVIADKKLPDGALTDLERVIFT